MKKPIKFSISWFEVRLRNGNTASYLCNEKDAFTFFFYENKLRQIEFSGFQPAKFFSRAEAEEEISKWSRQKGDKFVIVKVTRKINEKYRKT